jgi:hypothetical protein
MCGPDVGCRDDDEEEEDEEEEEDQEEAEEREEEDEEEEEDARSMSLRGGIGGLVGCGLLRPEGYNPRSLCIRSRAAAAAGSVTTSVAGSSLPPCTLLVLLANLSAVVLAPLPLAYALPLPCILALLALLEVVVGWEWLCFSCSADCFDW